MSAHDLTSLPPPPPTPHLLSLPTEILQSIYLFCLSPHLPHASPVLTSPLSTDLIYKLTFLHAFWNINPLAFAGTQAQQSYEPGPHVRSLFQPLPVPRAQQYDAEARKKLQETVLAYRWCSFNRAKLYFSSIIQAATRDLFLSLDIPLTPHDQHCFQSFIAHLPASPSTFEATALDGCHITLEYPRRFATALLMIYRGPDPRFDQRSSPNLTIRPTEVLLIPSHALTGEPEWTKEKVDSLRMLCSYVNLRTVQYSLPAFHEGMRNAIVQGNYEALLVLIWQADRLAEYKESKSYVRPPFEPPAELFRLVAKCGTQDTAPSGCHSSDKNFNNPLLSIKLFTLLLRAHAEAMPQNDPDITAWAHQLLKYEDCAEYDQAEPFAQWVLDWGFQKRRSEFLEFQITTFRVRNSEHMIRRRRLFNGGGVSRFWAPIGKETARRFVELCGSGGTVVGFGDEADGVAERFEGLAVDMGTKGI
ncbi:MAG: hypothetical protein ASARMPREDX12_001680 [Alectoria sarmentosa]|nr:MAG: hypothetical protein ASARMPREDX12_001680 [Alectoria sarmentosa]